MTKGSWMQGWGWGVLLGLLQVLVLLLLLLLQEHRRDLGLQDPGEERSRCSEASPVLIGDECDHWSPCGLPGLGRNQCGRLFPNDICLNSRAKEVGGDYCRMLLHGLPHGGQGLRDQPKQSWAS